MLKSTTSKCDLFLLASANLSLSFNNNKLGIEARARFGIIYQYLRRLDIQPFSFMLNKTFLLLTWNQYTNVFNIFIQDVLSIEFAPRRSSKSIPGVQNIPYLNCHDTLNLFLPKSCHTRSDLFLTFNMLHNFRHPIRNILTLRTTTHSRCHSYKLYRHQCLLRIEKYFFFKRICLLWNVLPTKLVSLNNVTQFRHRLDYLWRLGSFAFDHLRTRRNTWPIQSSFDKWLLMHSEILLIVDWYGKWICLSLHYNIYNNKKMK